MAIAGVIFLGGNSRRMGRDKATLELCGLSLFNHTASRLAPQCTVLGVSVRTPRTVKQGYDEILDPDSGENGGPLLGVLAALRWASELEGVQYLVTSPVDTPFLPTDLAEVLKARLTEKKSLSAVAVSHDRIHGLTALYDLAILPQAERLIMEKGERMLQAFHLELGSVPAAFPTQPVDPFFNINAESDLAQAAAEFERLKSL